MPRSVWKGPFVDGYLLAKAEKATRSIFALIDRKSTIDPSESAGGEKPTAAAAPSAAEGAAEAAAPGPIRGRIVFKDVTAVAGGREIVSQVN